MSYVDRIKYGDKHNYMIPFLTIQSTAKNELLSYALMQALSLPPPKERGVMVQDAFRATKSPPEIYP